MKITLDMPDISLCAIVTYVVAEADGTMRLQSTSLDGWDMRDGNTIKIPREAKEEV